jgi:hypothetical protein
MTFRSGVATWDVGSKFTPEAKEVETFVISGFGITEYSIRVEYAGSDVYLLYPDKRSGMHILQGFLRRKGAKKLLFRSLVIGPNHWPFPWTTNGKVIGIADTIVDISTDQMTTKSLAVPASTVMTAFHLTGALLACIQQSDNTTTLYLFCSNTKAELASSLCDCPFPNC